MADVSLLDGEIVRLVYHADSAADIIHPFSVKGYEMLTAEFMGWVESMRPIMPRNRPVLLEIVGCPLTDEEKAAIDNAIWTHYRLRLAEARKTLKASWKKLLIFVPCLLLSAVLLFWARSVQNEVLTQYLYLPFWFFSYRILTYPLFDHLPLLREMTACMQMASLRISTPQVPGQLLTEQERADILRDYKTFRREAHQSTQHSRLKEQLLMDSGVLSFGCTVSRVEDLLNPHCGEGAELLSDTLSDYLSQAEPLVDAKDQLRLVVDGVQATEEEKRKVSTAIRNSYLLRARSTRNDMNDNWSKIIRFTLCLLITSILLNSWGKRVDVAIHELLMVLFWFFGDYLVELILLTHLDLSRQRKKWKQMAATEVVFSRKAE